MTSLTDLPEDIWVEVCSYLNFHDRFQLAVTCKETYSATKSIESEDYLTVDFIAKKNVNGALLARQVKKVFVVNNFKPIELYLFLQIFKRVTVVNLTDDNLERANAAKLVSYLQQSKRMLDVIVKKGCSATLKNEVLASRCCNLNIIEDKKRKIDAEDGPDRLVREASPVSVIMEPLKAALLQYEERLRKVILSPNSCIPPALRKFDIAKQYCSASLSLPNIISGETTDDAVSLLGSAFVESILLSNEGHYVLVTQLEVYCKDSAVDDTSINNLKLSTLDHEKRVVVAVERKTAQKIAWYELKLYYKNYELLVTGAVCGHVDDETYDCFLGSSKAPTSLMQQSNWIVIAPETPVRCQKDFRLLQSFRNNASTFEWAFKSQKFVDKGFHTGHPLTLYKDHNRDIDYYSLASFILHCGSQGPINRSQLEQCIAMAEKIEVWKDLGLSSKPKLKKESIEAIEKNNKLGKFKKWMLEFIYCSERDATNEELTLLYKQFFYQKLRATHDRRMKLLK